MPEFSSKGMQITSLKYGNVKRKHAASKQIYCSRISSIFLNIENKANKATQKTGKLFYNHNANELHWIHTPTAQLFCNSTMLLFSVYESWHSFTKWCYYINYIFDMVTVTRGKNEYNHIVSWFLTFFFASNENLECK